MTEKQLYVHVITPNGTVYEGHATFVLARTVSGELGILPQHLPLLTPLAIDELRVDPVGEKESEYIAINGGILEVRHDEIIILADSAEKEVDIDVPRAERAKKRAERLIQEAKEQQDIDQLERATIALHRAVNRINVSKHRH